MLSKDFREFIELLNEKFSNIGKMKAKQFWKNNLCRLIRFD
jgi:hypothetical protein